MVCMKLDDQCGSTADLLRPLPAIVRVAADTKRILWILLPESAWLKCVTYLEFKKLKGSVAV